MKKHISLSAFFLIPVVLFLIPATSAIADPLFDAAKYYSAGNGSTSITTGDFNEDGHTDLVVTNVYSDNVIIRLGAGNGTFPNSISYYAGDEPRLVTTVDFDEDGHADLTVANNNADNVAIIINLTGEATAVKDGWLIPVVYSLSSINPIPFNPTTTL